jgi:ribosomal protein L35AE/L33A
VTNVLSFSDGEAIEPQEEIIKTLDSLLSRAKAGQMVGLSYAYVRPDGTTATGYNEGLHGLNLVAATSILAHRITSAFA